MKTTIKTVARQIVVQPDILRAGSVSVTVLPNPLDALGMCITLTQDQIGALLFALEQAAEAARINQERRDFGLVGTRCSVQAAEDRMAA